MDGFTQCGSRVFTVISNSRTFVNLDPGTGLLTFSYINVQSMAKTSYTITFSVHLASYPSVAPVEASFTTKIGYSCDDALLNIPPISPFLDQVYKIGGPVIENQWQSDDQLVTVDGTWLDCGPLFLKWQWEDGAGGTMQNLDPSMFSVNRGKKTIRLHTNDLSKAGVYVIHY